MADVIQSMCVTDPTPYVDHERESYIPADQVQKILEAKEEALQKLAAKFGLDASIFEGGGAEVILMLANNYLETGESQGLYSHLNQTAENISESKILELVEGLRDILAEHRIPGNLVTDAQILAREQRAIRLLFKQFGLDSSLLKDQAAQEVLDLISKYLTNPVPVQADLLYARLKGGSIAFIPEDRVLDLAKVLGKLPTLRNCGRVELVLGLLEPRLKPQGFEVKASQDFALESTSFTLGGATDLVNQFGQLATDFPFNALLDSGERLSVEAKARFRSGEHHPVVFTRVGWIDAPGVKRGVVVDAVVGLGLGVGQNADASLGLGLTTVVGEKKTAVAAYINIERTEPSFSAEIAPGVHASCEALPSNSRIYFASPGLEKCSGQECDVSDILPNNSLSWLKCSIRLGANQAIGSNPGGEYQEGEVYRLATDSLARGIIQVIALSNMVDEQKSMIGLSHARTVDNAASAQQLQQLTFMRLVKEAVGIALNQDRVQQAYDNEGWPLLFVEWSKIAAYSLALALTPTKMKLVSPEANHPDNVYGISRAPFFNVAAMLIGPEVTNHLISLTHTFYDFDAKPGDKQHYAVWAAMGTLGLLTVLKLGGRYQGECTEDSSGDPVALGCSTLGSEELFNAPSSHALDGTKHKEVATNNFINSVGVHLTALAVINILKGIKASVGQSDPVKDMLAIPDTDPADAFVMNAFAATTSGNGFNAGVEITGNWDSWLAKQIANLTQ